MKIINYSKSKKPLLRQVVMCSPSVEYFIVDNKQKHNITESADKNIAIYQHRNLVKTIENLGTEVLLINELKAHPNSVFTKDTAVSIPAGYIKLRMGISSREGEETWMNNYLDEKKITKVASINYPGTVEGGDVIIINGTVFVGISTRTNEFGAFQLKEILEKQGFEVRIFQVPQPFLHLGGAMSAIDKNTVLCVENLFSVEYFTGFKVINIPNKDYISGNVISLGQKNVIININNQGTIRVLKDEGFTISECDLSEFAKGTGGPSCLIMPIIE